MFNLSVMDFGCVWEEARQCVYANVTVADVVWCIVSSARWLPCPRSEIYHMINDASFKWCFLAYFSFPLFWNSYFHGTESGVCIVDCMCSHVFDRVGDTNISGVIMSVLFPLRMWCIYMWQQEMRHARVYYECHRIGEVTVATVRVHDAQRESLIFVRRNCECECWPRWFWESGMLWIESCCSLVFLHVHLIF